MSRLVVPVEAVRRETTASNSRFVADLAPADSPEEARAYIAARRAEFPDATHHVPAFIIGGGNSVTEFCSDDGEPSGTSGKPVLAVLKGSGLGNVVVVVTRWFGGTLLGTGGLVKAYGDAARAVVAAAARAELVPAADLSLRLPYPLLVKTRAALEACSAETLEERFAEGIEIDCAVPLERRAELEERLLALSAGGIVPVKLGERLLRKRLDG